MKRVFIYLCSVLLGTGIAGCNDFLEESSQDEVRPSTVADLEQLLLGEGYLRSSDRPFDYLELLTDNVQNDYNEDLRTIPLLKQGSPAFTWDPDLFEKMDESHVVGAKTWENLYAKIKGCNVILDMLDKVAGSKENKGNQKGQALALRGYYYFLLVNVFAEPYTKEGIDWNQALGVPLILSSEVKDEFPERKSIAQVYGQIERDLFEAADLMERYGQNNICYKVTSLFVYNLLSRMYLYMGDWENSAKYASEVIKRKPQLRNLSDFVVTDEWFGTTTYDIEHGGVLNYDSPELIWGYGSLYISEAFFQAPDIFTFPGSLPVFSVSEKFLTEYEEGDLRLMGYYQQYIKGMDMSSFLFLTGILHGNKSDWNNPSNPHRGMRTAEAYLNRAEANIRLSMEKGNADRRVKALADLNFLREHRYAPPYRPLELTDGESLLKICLDERRKELAFDDHRWFDLRRCGMPELVHEMKISKGQIQKYILEKGSRHYVLPIPKKVLEKNPALIQNPV